MLNGPDVEEVVEHRQGVLHIGDHREVQRRANGCGVRYAAALGDVPRKERATVLGNAGLPSPRSPIQPGDVDLAKWKVPQRRPQQSEGRDVRERQFGPCRSQHPLRPDQVATDVIELCPMLS